jgi:hypothetical protein
MINFFQNLALFRVKNAIFFAKFFGENIFKIITSVPDWAKFLSLNWTQILTTFVSEHSHFTNEFYAEKVLIYRRRHIWQFLKKHWAHFVL